MKTMTTLSPTCSGQLTRPTTQKLIPAGIFTRSHASGRALSATQCRASPPNQSSASTNKNKSEGQPQRRRMDGQKANSFATMAAERQQADDNYQTQEDLQQHKKDLLLVELLKLGKLALPLLLQYVIANSSHLVNTSFVGHLSDPVLLSSMVLATSLSMATGYSIMSGAASASETLCGQAYGAKNYQALQSTLQRALMIVGLVCVPITMAWSNAEWILTSLGQPEAIAGGAARYLQLTLPALYMYCIHECVDKYLLSQRVVKPSLVITAATTALTPLFAWWFVVHEQLGLDGAAYAYVGVQACTTGLGLAYLAYRELVQLPANPPEGWTPMQPSMSALTNWGPYIALAVPAVLSYCMEGWATEVLIFLSGLLDNADVAVGVTGLALQFSTLVWLAAASIGSATSTRVANKLGRGDAAGAKRTAQTAIGTVLATQTLIGFGAYTFAEPLLGLMTSNTETIHLALQVMPVLACCFIADGLNVVQGSVLRGAGRQWWTAGLSIAGWWGVGVPLAYYLAIVKGGNVPGLWAGFATASAIQSGLQFLAVNKFVDWEHEVQRAKEMMAGLPPPETSDDDDSGDSGSSSGGSGSRQKEQAWVNKSEVIQQEQELVRPPSLVSIQSIDFEDTENNNFMIASVSQDSLMPSQQGAGSALHSRPSQRKAAQELETIEVNGIVLGPVQSISPQQPVSIHVPKYSEQVLSRLRPHRSRSNPLTGAGGLLHTVGRLADSARTSLHQLVSGPTQALQQLKRVLQWQEQQQQAQRKPLLPQTTQCVQRQKVNAIK